MNAELPTADGDIDAPEAGATNIGSYGLQQMAPLTNVITIDSEAPTHHRRKHRASLQGADIPSVNASR